jgi:hypothetical protein
MVNPTPFYLSGAICLFSAAMQETGYMTVHENAHDAAAAA